MKKRRDYKKHFRGLNSDGGVIRVRLYEESGGGSPVVVLSDPPENRNTSVTNLVEVLAAEVSEELGVVGSGTRFVEHYPRTERQIRYGIPEEFSLVTFSTLEGAEAVLGFVALRRIMVGGAMRPTFGTPDWKHVTRQEVTRILGEDIGGEILPEPAPEEDNEDEPVEKTPLGPERGAEFQMDLSLEWAEPNGDVILRRTPDFGRGLDLADHLQSILQTNVPWSVVEHSPSGFEFGYGGSGPADLALNILNMFAPPGTDGSPPVRCFEGTASPTAWDLHQAFKDTFIAPLERYADHRISGAAIRGWLAANAAGRKAS